MRHSAEYNCSREIGPGKESGKVFDLAPKGWFDFSWPVFGVAALLVGAVFASTAPQEPMKIWERAQSIFAHKPEALSNGCVLVVTTNPDRQLQVIATLSPRGFDPLLASGEKSVERQMTAHGVSIRMAVVDGTVANSAAIARRLLRTLPASRVVVLRPDTPWESIGPVLLDRL